MRLFPISIMHIYFFPLPLHHRTFFIIRVKRLLARRSFSCPGRLRPSLFRMFLFLDFFSLFFSRFTLVLLQASIP